MARPRVRPRARSAVPLAARARLVGRVDGIRSWRRGGEMGEISLDEIGGLDVCNDGQRPATHGTVLDIDMEDSLEPLHPAHGRSGQMRVACALMSDVPQRVYDARHPDLRSRVDERSQLSIRAGVDPIPWKEPSRFTVSDQSCEPAVVPGLEPDTTRHHRRVDICLDGELSDPQVRRSIGEAGPDPSVIVDQDPFGQFLGLGAGGHATYGDPRRLLVERVGGLQGRGAKEA